MPSAWSLHAADTVESGFVRRWPLTTSCGAAHLAEAGKRKNLKKCHLVLSLAVQPASTGRICAMSGVADPSIRLNRTFVPEPHFRCRFREGSARNRHQRYSAARTGNAGPADRRTRGVPATHAKLRDRPHFDRPGCMRICETRLASPLSRSHPVQQAEYRSGCPTVCGTMQKLQAIPEKDSIVPGNLAAPLSREIAGLQVAQESGGSATDNSLTRRADVRAPPDGATADRYVT